jgi:hypothetical protein
MGWASDLAKKQGQLVISCIEDRRDHCANGRGRRISCAFRRMIMRLMVPSSGRNNAGSRLVCLEVSAMRPERLRLSTRRTKPLRGGEDRALVHRPSASLTRPVDCDFAPCLCRCAAPCYSPPRVTLGGGLGPRRHVTAVRHPSQSAPLTHLFNLLKAKAVPIAASSSALYPQGRRGLR